MIFDAVKLGEKGEQLTKGTMADVKSLEHPTLKVPYEILNKKFRIAQKHLDREVSLVLCSTPSVPQPVVQSRRRPLLGPSPG